MSYLSLLRPVLGRVVWGGRRGGGLVGGVHRVGVVVVQVVRVGTGAGRRGGRRLLTPQKGVQVSKGGREYGVRKGAAVGFQEGVLSWTTGERAGGVPVAVCAVTIRRPSQCCSHPSRCLLPSHPRPPHCLSTRHEKQQGQPRARVFIFVWCLGGVTHLGVG